uniref:Signal recognition particle 19 kDa protein n=1 Tax=Thermofilum pendens TaxID=2269 RepID=A0A7C4F911_THEPE
MRKKDGYVIWPAYFDAAHPRSKGRKVPLSLAVERPSLSELVEAARAAGYAQVVAEEQARYPAYWYEQPGRIIVKSSDKKSEVIKKIARALIELRKARRARR